MELYSRKEWVIVDRYKNVSYGPYTSLYWLFSDISQSSSTTDGLARFKYMMKKGYRIKRVCVSIRELEHIPPETAKNLMYHIYKSSRLEAKYHCELRDNFQFFDPQWGYKRDRWKWLKEKSRFFNYLSVALRLDAEKDQSIYYRQYIDGDHPVPENEDAWMDKIDTSTHCRMCLVAHGLRGETKELTV